MDSAINPLALTNPPVLLLAIPLFAAIIWIWRQGQQNLSAGRRALTLMVRLTIVVAVLLGLSGLQLHQSQNRKAVIFVSDLSASASAARAQEQAVINNAARLRHGDDQLGVVSIGRQALVEQPLFPLESFDGFQSSVNADATNLQAGTQLAGALLPDGYQRRVVLVTDGQQNIGDVVPMARLLRSQGVSVDVMPLHARSGPDVLVDQVTLPASLRAGESFPLNVSLASNVRTQTRVDIYRDSTLVLTKQERVKAGRNRYVFRLTAATAGSHSYRVRISPRSDSQPENNTGFASTTVASSPRVLVVAADSTKAVNVVSALRKSGIETSVQSPQQLVPSLSYLQRFASIVIVDTPAELLGARFLTALVPYVRDLGHGLVLIGGQESYGMGGYAQTPLDTVLPVKADLPKRRDLPSVAVALIIEDLEATLLVNISKEAGKGVVKLLTDADKVGVNDATAAADQGWVVPMRPVSDKTAIEQAIDQMRPFDPQSYARYLNTAYQALVRTNARVKHIILLGDGDAEDPRYQSIVSSIHRGGVTLSTITTNAQKPDEFQTMQNLARWGGGRYYRADDVSKVPRVFVREARTVARSAIVLGKFYPREVSNSSILSGLTRLPPLDGYVATAPKSRADTILVGKRLDPILSSWQFGLGRSVAWTSDASGLWTRQWLESPDSGRFWVNMVSWTLPTESSRSSLITSSFNAGRAHIAVKLPSNLGSNPTTQAHVSGPGGGAGSIGLAPSAGALEGDFAAPAEGTYFVTIQAHGNGHTASLQSVIDVPYPSEYRTLGLNWPLLQAAASAGRGSVINSPAAIWANNLPVVYENRSLAGILWLLALLLLPVDVALRRLIVTRRDLQNILSSFRLPALRAAWATATPSQRPAATVARRRPPWQPGLPIAPLRTLFTKVLPAGRSAASGERAPSQGSSRPAMREPARPPTTSASTVGRLLASKRQRQ